MALGMLILGVKLNLIDEYWKSEKRGIIIISAYLATIIVSGINSRFILLTFEVFLLQFFLVLILIYCMIIDENVINNIFIVLAVSLSVLCIYGIIQHFGLDPVRWVNIHSRRPSSFLGNPNFFAGYLVVCLPLIFALAQQSKKLPIRLIYIFIFLLGTYNLFLTWTRGAWLAFLASMCFLILMNSYTKKRLKIAIISLSIILIGLAFFGKSRIYEYFNFSNQSVVERVFKWKTAFEMIKDHPIIGVGAGNLKVNFALYQEKVREQAKFKVRGTSESNVHNEFFQILAEQGLLGFAFFILMFGYIFYKYFISRKTPVIVGLVSGIVGFLVFSISNFPLRIIPTAIAVFFFYGIILRLINFNNEKKYYIIKISWKRWPFLIMFCMCSFFLLFYWGFAKFRAEVLRYKGDEAFAKRQYMKAIAYYKNAINLDYYHSERTAYDLGESFRAINRIDDALEAYKISVDLRNYGEVYHDIGNCYYLKNDYKNALTNWERAYNMGLPDEKDQNNLEINMKKLKSMMIEDKIN
ncbi:MAG: O-antigen ligase family protein [bacterium]